MRLRNLIRGLLVLVLAAGGLAAPAAGASFPEPVEGDFVLHDFRFGTGETLPELKLHYRTLGRPVRDDRGRTTNAVLVLHGTGGSGSNFLSETFAGQLFGPGRLLDAARYFIVLPDGIGHGQSSKPSDGLRLRFPRYTYDDMVAAQYRLLTEGLQVNHLSPAVSEETKELDRVRQTIVEDKVWFPSPSDLNDPFDCRLSIAFDGNDHEWRDRFRALFRREKPEQTAVAREIEVSRAIAGGHHKDPVQQRRFLDYMQEQINQIWVFCLSEPRDSLLRLQPEVDVPHLLEVRLDDLFGDAGPPVEVQGGKLLRRVLAGALHLQLDDLRLRRQMDEPETPAVRKAVDSEGTGDEPGDGDGVEPVASAEPFSPTVCRYTDPCKPGKGSSRRSPRRSGCPRSLRLARAGTGRDGAGSRC